MSEDFLTAQTRKQSKKALGRGLGSLLGEISAADVPPPNQTIVAEKEKAGVPVVAASKGETPQVQNTIGTRVWKVAIEKLSPNREQPRKKFDAEKLQDLAQSIKEKGILLPILARKISENSFQIIAGERRWRAAQVAGLKEVPVILREVENQEALEEAIVENVQRHDLNPMEEAEAYSILANKYLLTQQQIAEKVGKDRATIANLMRLTGLVPEVRELVKAGEIHLGQAKVLLSLSDNKQQLAAAKKAIQLRLSVRALEKYVAKLNDPEAISLANTQSNQEVKKHLAAVVSELQRLFGTKVAIEGNGIRGKIEINYYNKEELNQLIDKMRRIKT